MKQWYMKHKFKLTFADCIKLLFKREFNVKFIAPYGTADASCTIIKE